MKKTLYWTLFGIESAGMVFILYEALPLYRRLIRGPGGEQPGSRLLLPGLLAVVVMQVSYWTKRRVRPPIAGRSVFLGHILLFLSRLIFIFAGALLSLVLLTRSADTRTSPLGIAILVAVTFAQFCHLRELETGARRFEE